MCTGGESTPRLIDALCRPEPGTPLPVPLPSRCDGATARRVGRGEGESSAGLWRTGRERNGSNERCIQTPGTLLF